MKKLALALVCLVSVAFFASCTDPVENPQPSIQILNEAGYIQDSAIVDVDTDVLFGFVVASNPQTQKELASLVVKVGDIEWANKDLTGMTEYTYRDTVNYGLQKDMIIGVDVITAVVTDVAGQTATATIHLSINQPAQPLIGSSIEWIRRGSNVEETTAAEMATYGLQWTGSYKAAMVTIEPLNDDVIMYLCNGDDYATITNTTEKVNYFSALAESNEPIAKYREITTNNSADYNDMLAVIYGDNQYLIHITHATIDYIPSVRTDITITGEAK